MPTTQRGPKHAHTRPAPSVRIISLNCLATCTVVYNWLSVRYHIIEPTLRLRYQARTNVVTCSSVKATHLQHSSTTSKPLAPRPPNPPARTQTSPARTAHAQVNTTCTPQRPRATHRQQTPSPARPIPAHRATPHQNGSRESSRIPPARYTPVINVHTGPRPSGS